MLELKLANSRIELNKDVKKLYAALDKFEKKPTKSNRSQLHLSISEVRKDITAIKHYVDGLYLKM